MTKGGGGCGGGKGYFLIVSDAKMSLSGEFLLKSAMRSLGSDLGQSSLQLRYLVKV